MATNGWRTIKVNSEQAERYPTMKLLVQNIRGTTLFLKHCLNNFNVRQIATSY